jgi:ankyrin repeat protein
MGQGSSSYHEGRYAAWAAKEGRFEDLQYHLTAGEDVRQYRDEERNTLMHYAAQGGYARCVEFLFLEGVKLDGVNGDGYTPLHLAVIRSKFNAVRKLLELGAKVNSVNKFGITPLHMAAHHGKLNCAQALLRCRANVDVQESWGQTPLMLAVSGGHVEIIVSLLHSGCNPWIAEHKSALTAVHIAAYTDVASLLTLLDDGVNPNTPTTSGITPLEVAIDNKCSDAVHVLLEYGGQCHPSKLRAESRPSRRPLVSAVAKMWGQPRSLKSLSRVALRRTLGPGQVDACVQRMGMEEGLREYILFREHSRPIQLTSCMSDVTDTNVKSKKLLL